MHHPPLTRRPHHAAHGQPFLDGLRLTRGRVHELIGPARQTLAMMVAGGMTGPVFWVLPDWAPGQPHGPGMVRFLDPGRVTFVRANRAEDILWTLEEVLRAGVVPLVVGDLPGPPGLTPVRRMQLAAETGGGQALGLILTPEGAAQGAESRWQMTPDHAPEREAWRLTRLRHRQDPPRDWSVRMKGDGFALAPPRRVETVE
ncbi:ImuA family protein [Aliiroseovarius sp.]|uniref:ImuA family protein n=1 Tax=Aliiroseovarius sp. TaxID=1872442 RepID=UPI003BA8ABFB